MKIPPLLLAFTFVTLSIAMAETVHQKAEGSAAYASSGKKAMEAGLVETMEVDGTSLTRVKKSMPQWGYVNYWMGLPSPAGKAVVRVRVYVAEDPVSAYALYLSTSDGQKGPMKLEVPKGAKAGSFVNLDIPVEHEAEWSGLTLKKMEAGDKPGPWIASISVLLE